MANKKKYTGDFGYYETKLRRVMERLGVSKFDYNWDRSSCYIEYWYKGEYYRFEHSVSKAAEHGQKLTCVSDLFAQLVMSLEDIARMVGRGIYDLATWIEGMKALPPKQNIPQCFNILGFDYIPTEQELNARYKEFAKICHPDVGGNSESFKRYTNAYTEAKNELRKLAE